MNERAPNASTNLVVDGDLCEAYEFWEDGNPDSLYEIESEEWQGSHVNFLLLQEEAAAYQMIDVPFSHKGDDARYRLTFFYEIRGETYGMVSVINERNNEKVEIGLPAQRPLQDQAEPLALTLVEHEMFLDLGLQQGDQLKVMFSHVKDLPNVSNQKVIVTLIELHLVLAPLQLQRMINDDQSFETGQTLYLCLGAEGETAHRLRFEPLPDSPWAALPAALWTVENPQEAILIEPTLGENQTLDLAWRLDCPVLKGDAPFLFSLSLHNQYTAEPYTMDVSLGHHRLEMNVLQGADVWPVLEYAQTVPLEVQVVSYYTRQPVPGQEVTWSLGQEILYRGESDREGKASFDFTPASKGEQVIRATVSSPYYQDASVQQAFDVRVLEFDPFNTVQVRFENGPAAIWGEKTGFPDRASSYPFTVVLPEDSPLRDDSIAVHWSEGGYLPEELDVTCTPDFGELIVADSNELAWTLLCGDKLDARFGLFLSSPHLLCDSRSNAMSLARNTFKIGDWREANKSPVVDEGDSVHCMLQVLSKTDEPALNIPVDWIISGDKVATTLTGTGGWASVFHTPTQAQTYEIIAQVQLPDGGVPLEHSFTVISRSTSGWKDHIECSLDTQVIDRNHWGVVCRSGSTHKFRIAPTNDASPFIGQPITLNWRGGTDPAPGLVFVPALGAPHPLTKEGLEWTVTSGASYIGLFELEVTSGYLEEKRELSGRLLGESIKDEATLLFDQLPSMMAEKTLHPCLGAVHTLRVLPHAFSPLLGLELHWSGAEPPPGLVITPDKTTGQVITAGGVQLSIDCSDVPQKAEYSILLTEQSGDSRPAAPVALSIDHNKLKPGELRPVAVDPVLDKGECVHLEVQFRSWFSDVPVAGKTVAWSWDALGAPSDSVTDNNGWARFDYAPSRAGLIPVRAKVVNPYDDSEAVQTVEVNALQRDPWQDLRVQTDDGDGEWGASFLLPRHNGEFDLTLSANEESYLRGQRVALGLTGTGPNALNMAIEPVPLGDFRDFDKDLPVTLKSSEVKDGSFSLRLAATRLLSLSPSQPVSLGAPFRGVTLSADNRVLQMIYWGGKFEAAVTAVSRLGEPVAGLPVYWEGPEGGRVSTVTNFYGVAKIQFTPKIPRESEVIAKTGDEHHWDSVSFRYTLIEPRKIQSLFSPKPNGYLGELVSAVVTVISARTGAPLQGVEVVWDYPDRTIAPTRTDAEGNARVEFRMPGIRRGLLEAAVPGGYGGWEVKFIKFELVPNMTTSSTWLQEFRPYINGVEVDWLDAKLTLVAGEIYTLKLDYKYSWLIGEPEGFLALECTPVAEDQGLVFSPPLEELQEMAKGTTSMSWSISTERAHSGPFVLQFALPNFEQLPKSPSLPGEVVDIAQELEVKFDEFPVTLGRRAYPCHGARHTVTVRPTPTSHLQGMHVKLVWSGDSAVTLGVLVTPDPGEARQLNAEGVTWALDCSESRKSGDFSLRLIIEEWGFETKPIDMFLAHNLVSAYRWADFSKELWNIRATSKFLNQPAPGVSVLVLPGGGGVEHKVTQENGEVSDPMRGEKTEFIIVNRYDGSNV
ncbi:Ig-like domain-containing protein [Pseudomonas sp. B21-048]|uniref:Ig-like domain-containing protein n=1 Tax=Pseudomonas sp. B21-048 TaxID=2895490 RepID=UPI00215F4D4A|nr:Ig-like domain-containing protein [Pseudomonas sp. B21-048]UVK97659.1 Ig-like domain-containing protein [Pseudomonas sp. B21-048]